MYKLTLGKRYLLLGIICFVVSVYIGLNLTLDTPYTYIDRLQKFTCIFACLCILICGIIIFIFPKRNIRYMCISSVSVILIFILGFTYTLSLSGRYQSAKDFLSTQSSLCCKVTSTPTLSNSQKSYSFYGNVYLTSKEQNIHHLKTPQKVLIYLKADSDINSVPKLGDCIIVKKAKILNSSSAIEGGYDYDRYLRQKEVVCTYYATYAKISNSTFDVKSSSAFTKVSELLRTSMYKSTDAYYYPNDNSALLKGILLGDKTDFSEDGYNNLSKSGFMHIAAVSGMHISYLLLLLTAMFKLSGLSKRLTVPALILCLFIFAGAAEYTPSVLRAVLMMSVALLAILIRRSNDSLTSIGICAFLLLLSNPYYLESVSALLSFGATIGILVFYGPIRNSAKSFNTFIKDKLLNAINHNHTKTNYRKDLSLMHKVLSKILKIVADSVCLSLGATVGILYFMAKIFGTVQWGSIIGNIIIVPLTGVIFICGAINTVVYQIFPFLAYIIGKFILNPALSLANKIISIFSAEVFSINLPVPHKSFFVIYIIICISLYLLLEQPQKDKVPTKS